MNTRSPSSPATALFEPCRDRDLFPGPATPPTRLSLLTFPAASPESDSVRRAARKPAGYAERMRGEWFQAIHASPCQRTQETANAIAAVSGHKVQTAAELGEIDFGSWSGKSFVELQQNAQWRRWNERRDVAAAAGGETMRDVQDRIVGYIEALQVALADRAVVLVSHAEVIKAAVARYLGLPLSGLERFEIAPASITTLVVGSWGAKLRTLNETIRED